MAKKINTSQNDDHNFPPVDKATKEKIDKHLSDINDTISEEDIKNINTSTGASSVVEPNKNAGEESQIDEDDDNEPEKEAPSSWEILS